MSGGWFGFGRVAGGLLAGSPVAHGGEFGKVFIPNAVAAANLIIRSTAGSVIADVAAGGAPADQITGDFGTITGHGAGIFFRLQDAGADFQMQAFCSVPAFGFTSINMLDFSQLYTSATAVFAGGCGFNTWTWVGRALGLAPTTVYSMFVTP